MSKFDKKIKALSEKVESERAVLGKKPRASWNTNAVFNYDSSKFFNLNTIRDTSKLVDALSFLLERSTHVADAAERLGIETPEFVWYGYSLSDWEHDFKLRVEILNWDKRKKQLDNTEKKLSTLLSEEAKTEMELAELEKLL